MDIGDMTAKYFHDIREGNADAVEERLKRWPSWATERNPDGISPLMMALYHQQSNIIRILMSKGIELDIHEAAALGQDGRVRLLLELDESLLNTYSADGFTPLHLAAFFDEEEVLDVLLEYGANPRMEAHNYMHVQPLHSAVAGKNLRIVEKLIEAGADVNAAQQHELTALHAAAQEGLVEIAKVLIRHEADKKALDDKGRTPSEMAETAGHQALVELLAGLSR
jgi:uncharacterized protein